MQDKVTAGARRGGVVALAVAVVALGVAAQPAAAAEGPTVADPIPVGNSPYQIGALPALGKVFVAENADGTVGVLRAGGGEITRIPLPGKQPLSVAVNKKTNTVYVGTYQDTIEVIDGATNTVKATHKVGEHAHSIGVDEQNDRIAVANSMSNTVTLIAKDWSVGVNVGKLPVKPTFSARGDKLYVTNAESNTISVIGTAPDDYWPTVDKTLNTEFWPLQSDLDPATGKLYVSNWKHGTVQVVDTATDNVTASIKVGEEPTGVAVSPDTHSVYVANAKSSTVSVIDGVSGTVRATVPAKGYGPLGVAVFDPKTVYFSNRISNNVNVLTDPGA